MTRYVQSKQEALRERVFKFYLENQGEKTSSRKDVKNL